MRKIQDLSIIIEENRKEKLTMNTEIDGLKDKISGLTQTLNDRNE